jgi:hypothetical protein
MALDWKKLKEEYISGNVDSISSFLDKKGIKRNGYISRLTKGWNESRWSYQAKLREARREVTIKHTSKIDAEFNAKRLKIARNLQLKSLRALQYQEPETVFQSLQMFTVGMGEEREAMGLNNKNDNSSTTQVEPLFMKTRFAQALKESLYTMSDEKFAKLLCDIQAPV